MDTKERILNLLGSGLDSAVVASAVGVTPGYVSQLLADQDFASKVIERRTIELTRAKGLDDSWDEIEERLLDKIKDLIPFLTKPRDLIQLLVYANNAKRKTTLTAGAGAGGQEGNTVTVNLPQIVINQYKITMAGGMTEVAGRTLDIMKSSDLMKSLEKRRSDGKEPQLLEHFTEKSRNQQAGQNISADSV